MSAPNGPFTGRPATYAPRGMVATSHGLATQAGVRALRDGGSAVDAAIAANAVLCVAYPHMAGLGGDGFWLVHDAEKGGVDALTAAGPAAEEATRAYYVERGHAERIPERGALAALTVPGAVDGWRLAHERHGNLEWRRLFEDAIRYARDGVPVGRSLEQWLARDVFLLRAHPRAARTYLPGNRTMVAGDRLVQRELANTFETLAREGPRDGFYEGTIAETVCEAVGPEGSPLTQEDFARFEAEWVEPLSTTYRGRTVFEFPPPTQGFSALMILNLLEGYDLTRWGDASWEYFHHAAEAVKVAFADRDEWLTDPKFVDIPLDKLLGKEYADERRDLIRPEDAWDMNDVEPGIPFTETARRAERAVPAGDTCAFQAVDADGLVVSSIQSIYQDFGSGVIAGDTGIILQNRGSFFSLDADHPNRLEPGKRTFHTLTPGMMFEDDAWEVAFGTMGGEGQPQTHAALITRLVDFGYDVQQAIEAPRWLVGRTWGRPVRDLSLEGRVSDNVMRALKRIGQPVRALKDWDAHMGHAHAIRIDRGTGFLEGGADPRGDGAASGY